MTNFAGLPRAVGEALQDEPVPDWRPPTLATLTEDRFSDPHWIFERKFDGMRCVSFRDGDRLRLLSRNRKPLNGTYPELVDALAAQRTTRFVVDGEVVAAGCRSGVLIASPNRCTNSLVDRAPVHVVSAAMSSRGRRLLPIAAVTIIAVGAQLNPATARADLHNITYRARVDGVTTGTQAIFVINGGQTNTAGLSSMPGNAFEADTVLPDPQQAGMRVVVHFPYSANVHCEIDVDDNVFVQSDQMVRPVAGSADPMNGALQCGAPLP